MSATDPSEIAELMDSLTLADADPLLTVEGTSLTLAFSVREHEARHLPFGAGRWKLQIDLATGTRAVRGPDDDLVYQQQVRY